MNKPQDVDLSIREDLLKSSRPFSVNDTSMMNTLHDEESVIADDVPKIEEDSNGKPAEEIYSIKKNEIFVGEQRFKATGSFLLLVKMICDNYNLALKFSSIESEAIAKLFETLKVRDGTIGEVLILNSFIIRTRFNLSWVREQLPLVKSKKSPQKLSVPFENI